MLFNHTYQTEPYLFWVTTVFYDMENDSDIA